MIENYLNNQGVTLASVSSHTVDGSPSWSSAVPLRCRYEAKRRRLSGPNGDPVTSMGRLFVSASQVASLNDKVTYNGESYRVIQIDEEMGFNGLSHKVLWLGENDA